MSGYLLAAPFLRWLLDDAARPSTRLFLIRRVLRIVPLYLVAVLFSIVVARMLGRTPAVTDIVAHLFMLQDFSAATVQTPNGPLWTIPVDFEFYLALPVLAALPALLFSRTTLARRRSFVVVGIGSGVILSLAYRFAVADRYPEMVRTNAAFVYLNNGIGMASAFLLGIALALVFERPAKFSPPMIRAYLVLAVTLFGIAALPFSNVTNFGLATSTTICAISACLFLLVLPHIPFVVALAQTRAVATGAALAYALYLFHFPVLELVAARMHVGHGNTSFATLTVVSIAVLLPLAYGAHRLVERPFLLLKDRQREGLRAR